MRLLTQYWLEAGRSSTKIQAEECSRQNRSAPGWGPLYATLQPDTLRVWDPQIMPAPRKVRQAFLQLLMVSTRCLSLGLRPGFRTEHGYAVLLIPASPEQEDDGSR